MPRHIAYGITLLRVGLGVMLIAHSVLLKYFVYTLPGTAQYFESIGLPGPLAYVVFWMEAVAGVMLLLGIGTRWVSLAMMPILLGATWAHIGNGWVFSNPNGGWEYPLYLTVLAGAQALLGSGAFALRFSPEERREALLAA
ncbi:DoxX family protein [Piscinibacter sakaiensis]|uniref:DoxX family protein n=1 Tax=Piscinibacter sakaiensis TaxID=1547922 RepID=UPI003AAD4F56